MKGLNVRIHGGWAGRRAGGRQAAGRGRLATAKGENLKKTDGRASCAKVKGENLVPGTEVVLRYLVPGVWYQVPGTRYQVPGTWYQGIWYQGCSNYFLAKT